MSDPDEPQSFQEAWWDPELISREKWREAICLEFKKMLDMGVWRHVKRNDRPNDHRLVGCRWVFKVKRNGGYCARLVAKDFSQIPGVDFTDNYFPVAWWDPDLISREKWREAIRLEFKKMLDMGVWRHVKRNDHPNDRRCQILMNHKASKKLGGILI